ncbi:MAG: hypothetical protein HS122_19770 [Opitutaceae bacterium]|nr:hypothetical protein [Opitutaceae bacterium]
MEKKRGGTREGAAPPIGGITGSNANAFHAILLRESGVAAHVAPREGLPGFIYFLKPGVL